MKHEKSTSLFQYWNRLRGNRPAPRRTEIEPADIKANLADTFILEQDTRGRPMFRLAGTRLCATFGRELKGFAVELERRGPSWPGTTNSRLEPSFAISA